MARRHGRPEPVTPRQVVSTFLESERARRDSGVLGMNVILVYEARVGLRQGYEDSREIGCRWASGHGQYYYK